MKDIKVHVLNFHSLSNSHLEIVLENTSEEPHTYYAINRWQAPKDAWSTDKSLTYDKASNRIKFADSVYSFDIKANPDVIISEWKEYHKQTESSASVLGENCAVAVQRFLTHFANIPKPSSSHISWNYLAFGIVWPSFIPCPVTLPGRIMDNVKFYTNGKIFQCNSISELPNEHDNKYIENAIKLLKTEQNSGQDNLIKLKAQ